jgi:outer membrane protein insertion porin family
MKKKLFLSLIIIFLIGSPFLFSETITSLKIVGNERTSIETIVYYLDFSKGNTYDIKRIDSSIKRLWETGFFDYIEIKKTATLKGIELTLIVKERPIVKVINFITKGIKEKDINKHLDEKNLKILPYSYYDEYRLKAAIREIKAYLKEKNYDDSEVRYETKFNKDKKDVTIEIYVNRGLSIKINKIIFTGNKTIPSVLLKWKLKEQREHSLIFSIFSKDTFSKEKLSKALDNLKEAYYNKGYLEVKIGKPVYKYIFKRDIFFRKRKMVNISIPIKEGLRYRIGKIKVEGNKILPTPIIKAILKLNKGQWYSLKKRNDGIKDIQDIYGNRGYFYCQVAPSEQLDPAHKKVNITINVQENKKAYLRFLNFKGNTYTKDFVLRREFFLREGDVFRLEFFKQSLKRMKQLGLVDIKEMPDVKPDPKDPSQIDIGVKVEELGRNMFQFSGGYSGYEGTFVMFSYSTSNFMGAGEKLSVMMMYGSRTKNYSFGFTEPYVFDLPVSLGFNVFNKSMVYPGLFDQQIKGASLSVYARLYRYLNLNLTYSYEKIKVNEVSNYFNSINPYYYYYYQMGERTFSSIIPNLYYSTVDSPLDPTSGVMYGFSLKFSGKFLGGDYSLIKPRFLFTKYFKGISKKHTLGIHFEGSFIKTLDDKEIPFYERFYIGGEMSVRGFEVYQIAPKDANGYVVGGDKLLQFNFEYKIPLGAQMPLNLILFADAANTWGHGVPASLKDMYSSLGAELRIFIPALNVPFRLIFAYNPRVLREGDNNFQMRFGVGTTF